MSRSSAPVEAVSRRAERVGLAAGSLLLCLMSAGCDSPTPVPNPPPPVPNPTPSVTSLEPNSAEQGDPAFILRVRGAGFVPQSQVLWDGSPRTTRYVDETELHAEIPGSDLAAVGEVQVSVSTPAPGGGLSEPMALRRVAPLGADVFGSYLLHTLGEHTLPYMEFFTNTSSFFVLAGQITLEPDGRFRRTMTTAIHWRRFGPGGVELLGSTISQRVTVGSFTRSGEWLQLLVNGRRVPASLRAGTLSFTDSVPLFLYESTQIYAHPPVQAWSFPKPSGPVAASVTIMPDSLHLTHGATHQLTATVHDADGAIIDDLRPGWYSSDATWATVNDDGLVTAVHPPAGWPPEGTAIITAVVQGAIGRAKVVVSP